MPLFFRPCPVTPALSAYLQPGDTVVACDAGYRNAAVLGIQPDLIVGDFDSAPKPETTGDMIILPHVKDDTDTHYAAKWLCERGYRHIVMLGALGGKRMEHTFSNYPPRCTCKPTALMSPLQTSTASCIFCVQASR